MRTRRGFTIIEVLVAGGLLLVVSLIAFAVVNSSMKAAQRGQMTTDEQRMTREIINRISSDMKAAVVLQPTSLGATSVPSAVLLPDIATATSTDDVVFTKSAKTDLGTLDLSRDASYIYVRYAIRPANGTTPAALFRRTYSYDPTCFDASAFSINISLLNTRGQPGTTQAGSTPTANDTPWEEIVSLVGPSDRMTFTVSHHVVGDGCPAGHTVNDGYHYRIYAKIQMYIGSLVHVPTSWTDAQDAKNDSVTRDLETEVTLTKR